LAIRRELNVLPGSDEVGADQSSAVVVSNVVGPKNLLDANVQGPISSTRATRDEEDNVHDPAVLVLEDSLYVSRA